ncbi:hypothetical protein BH10ACI2_BH10ACI2_05690 [soil metagenome]
MRSATIFLFLLTVVGAISAYGQHGGKAEPKRIQFAAGKSSATLTGTLSVDQEMEYVFGAVKGQKVTIKNSNHNLFDFRIFSEEYNVETEFESSPTLTIDIPATGDYMFFVRKKRVKTPKTVRFSLTMTIR